MFPPHSTQHTEVHDSSSTQNVANSEKDNPQTPMRTTACPAPLSPDGLLCAMHAKSPCTPTDLGKRSTNGPWFQRTPSLSLTTVTPFDSVTRRLDLGATPIVGGDNSCTTQKAATKDVSCVSTVEAVTSQERAKSRVSSTLVDTSHDDVISQTTQQVDGR